MADIGKALRQVRRAALERLVVTRVDLEGAGLRVDRALLEAAGLLPDEKVDVYDVTSGARFSTFVVAGEAGSGEVVLTGADAHLGRPGELLDLVAWGWLKEKQARRASATVVQVDAENRPPAPVTPPPDAAKQARKSKKKKAKEKPGAEELIRSGSR
ncbi:MAG: aspartate 1-decarboxylase [Myxococcaceae bacterium]|nr:aspartate 1-decarboxylase [Myxococcaceae bacterium]